MTYRIAKSLDRIRAQVNAHSPTRNKASDGWIGDAKHAASTSDHNPWVKDGNVGIVTAIDITHDPKNNMDVYAMAEHMRQQCDPRIKYVITNRRIFSSTNQPWVWRNYTGSSPHTTHVHISVNSTKNHFDNERDWSLGLSPQVPTTPTTPPATTRPTIRRGSTGDAVKELQRKLADGVFGTNTENEVKAFQRRNNLTADGVVGPRTWAELDKIK